LSLRGVISPSLLIHGGVGLDYFGGHTRAPTKPRESGVYDSSGVGTCCVPEDPTSPAPVGGIHHGMHGCNTHFLQE
jgi:hypothetical protein